MSEGAPPSHANQQNQSVVGNQINILGNVTIPPSKPPPPQRIWIIIILILVILPAVVIYKLEAPPQGTLVAATPTTPVLASPPSISVEKATGGGTGALLVPSITPSTTIPSATVTPKCLSIRIHVSRWAQGAEVYLDDDPLGPAGETVTCLLAPETNLITVRAPGFEPLTTNVFANVPNLGELAVVLCPTGFVPLPYTAISLTANQQVAASELLLPAAIENPKTGMQFALIPTGTLLRVASDLATSISGPIYVGVTEVTREQWAKAMTGRSVDSDFGDLPAEGTIAEIENLCRDLSRNGDLFRFGIPNETIWEYAARAGDTNAVAYVSPANLTNDAWFFNNSEAGPHSAGIFHANAWGLYDVIGNMDELCANENPAGTRYYARGGRFSTKWANCSVGHADGLNTDGSERVGVRLILAPIPCDRIYIYEDSGILCGPWQLDKPKDSRMEINGRSSDEPWGGDGTCVSLKYSFSPGRTCAALWYTEWVPTETGPDIQQGLQAPRGNKPSINLVLHARSPEFTKIRIQVGNIGEGKFPDSAAWAVKREQRLLHLSPQWQTYTINLDGLDLTCVQSPLYVAVRDSDNSDNVENGGTVYLDEIYFERYAGGVKESDR